MKFEVTTDEQTRELDLDPAKGVATIDGETSPYRFHRQKNGRYLLRVGRKLHVIDNVQYDKHTVEYTIDGTWCRTEVMDEQDLLLDKLGFKSPDELGEGQLNAPMPGKILEIMVSEGDTVELGDPVAILEAMKMENELKAPVSGEITSIAVSEGDSVEKNMLIMEIDFSG